MRIDLDSGEIVRVYFNGEAALATYADDSVEYFGDRASLTPYVHCTRDNKIYVGDHPACRLREAAGRFGK